MKISMKKIDGFIASDHRGFKLKKHLKENFSLIDLGVFDDKKKVDYPDYAKKLCNLVKKEKSRGILICGTGIGMSIAANRYKGIRAALCHDVKDAELARKHNDANVLVLSGDFTKKEDAQEIVKKFFNTPFSGEIRHKRRIKKIDYQ
ncbi:MAG: ribose 5-phosphate isomerase B [Candidatus Woesearchaeota archaeon]|nr:MAG: ribose 5-phosphate isomerase B [Candidatus Woesearchaeota archaeon]